MRRRILLCALMGLAAAGAARGGTVATGRWAHTAPSPRDRAPAAAGGDLLQTADERRAQEARIQQHLAAARDAARTSDWARATTEIEQGLALAPGRPDLLAAAGRIYLLQGAFGLALPCWQALLEQVPQQPSIQTLVGATYFYMNRLDQADTTLADVLARAPGEAGARFYLAALRLRQDRASDAAEALAAVPLADLVRALDSLGEERDLLIRSLGPAGYWQLARLLLGHPSLELNDDALARVEEDLRAAARAMSASRWADATEALRRAVQAGARAPAIAYNLALCRYRLAPSDKGLARLEQVVHTRPGGPAFARAFTYVCLQAEAYERAGRGLALLPEGDETTLMRAAWLAGRGLDDDAWQALQTIPPERRVALAPWFARDLPAIRRLRDDARFDAWGPGAGAAPEKTY